ncbi:MFS transporter, partial [Shewanella algae]|uniref:MFS transporter n=1 Tax=Shewanella algae TaxID=38313 RepID=UPI00313E0B33
SESGWISTAYLIAEIIVIPLTAFFSDRYGIRRYLLFNAFGFVVASILCGFSNNLTALVICRILQGFTGGTLIPLSFQLILLLMPEKQK